MEPDDISPEEFFAAMQQKTQECIVVRGRRLTDLVLEFDIEAEPDNERDVLMLDLCLKANLPTEVYESLVAYIISQHIKAPAPKRAKRNILATGIE